MKKISIAMIMTMILSMSVFAMPALATEESAEAKQNISIMEEVTNKSNASEVTLENLEEKDEKIAYYVEKYGDETEGKVAYALSLAQKYSIPVFFLLLIWGAFNRYILGSKKLHQSEKGFSMIVGAIIGLIIFQTIPLLYALIAAGR